MKSKKIMVADDDADILEVITLILNDKGFEVQTEINGEKLMQMKDNLPDLLLLDIWMSGIDGRDICKRLKSQDATRNLPIILLSANIDIQTMSSECGANDFLPKPFDINELVRKISTYI